MKNDDFERKSYETITLGYAGYKEQNVCQDCKYFRMRWRDSICEQHNRIINPIGICDKFVRNR